MIVTNHHRFIIIIFVILIITLTILTLLFLSLESARSGCKTYKDNPQLSSSSSSWSILIVMNRDHHHQIVFRAAEQYLVYHDHPLIMIIEAGICCSWLNCGRLWGRPGTGKILQVIFQNTAKMIGIGVGNCYEVMMKMKTILKYKFVTALNLMESFIL